VESELEAVGYKANQTIRERHSRNGWKKQGGGDRPLVGITALAARRAKGIDD
jgi:hypothetical protein